MTFKRLFQLTFVSFVILLLSIFTSFPGDAIMCAVFSILTGVFLIQLCEYDCEKEEIVPWEEEMDDRWL